ncbi:MAG: dTDP-4-dehydrorhamnose 3,5-epimerase [Bacteroidia bacterium]|nr:dTDP-4-dehydrorhamnose 3,5-epimerase [Bacteroidia bacterium]MCZ2276783.1 dTDP-4-dehydrorhamnose 3,5-epimerase [Bacteroidia bacterium]
MKFSTLEIPGLLLIEPVLYSDPRGYFFESFQKNEFVKYGIRSDFVQDNQSLSGKNILRGLHFQAPPYEQGKLVRVIKGRALDVIVDIRKGSPAYGKYVQVMLSDKNHWMLWIPPGFAHGFLSCEEDTIFYYKCTNYYNRGSENGIIWNDTDLNIDWKTVKPEVSEKDLLLPPFNLLDSPFTF